ADHTRFFPGVSLSSRKPCKPFRLYGPEPQGQTVRENFMRHLNLMPSVVAPKPRRALTLAAAVRAALVAGTISFGALAANGIAAAADVAAAIAPQPLATALTQFSASTGLQIVYRTELTEGIQSRGAPTGLGAEQTLQELLRDTGLRFEFINAKTV